MAGPRRGFTLIELGVVIAIIGILVAFVLAVGSEGVRNAEVRATQSLITKLEVGLTDRIEALSNVQVTTNTGHAYFAAVPNPNYPSSDPMAPPQPQFLRAEQREQVIARVEMFRNELTEVWFPDTTNTDYPVQFPAQKFNPDGVAARGRPYDYYVSPMGAALVDNPSAYSLGAIPATASLTTISPIPGETGIFGASHSARAALTRGLGYLDRAADGSDNDGDGLIDNLSEGNDGTVATKLASHRHRTARAEALYALLTQGRGPLGSIFNPDDFTTKEVQDTDGDGLPEFIDSWGNPLQFYLWPIYYQSDTQRGPDLYLPLETREKHPLDPNLELVSPAWWADITSTTDSTRPALKTPYQARALLFSKMFFSLFEPNYPANATAAPPTVPLWDRQNVYGRRREFYTKFLIVSAGPDGALGLHNYFETPAAESLIAKNTAAANSTLMLGDFDSDFPYDKKGPSSSQPGENWGTPKTLRTDLYGVNNSDGEDDISNQKLRSPGGGTL